jgi:hypothetical protein
MQNHFVGKIGSLVQQTFKLQKKKYSFSLNFFKFYVLIYGTTFFADKNKVISVPLSQLY